MTITAPASMRKIIFTLERISNFVNRTTISSGQFVVDDSNSNQAIWYGDAAEVNFVNTTYSANNINLEALTIICDTTDNKATVTFFDFDGKELKTEEVKFGEDATAPTYDHECFAGWDKEFTKVRSDLEIHPVHKEGCHALYTVIFYDINGQEIKREEVKRGESATAPTDMEVPGYTFKGWDTDFTNLRGEEAIIHVHPLYTEAGDYVNVRFEQLDGTLIELQRIPVGGSVTHTPEVPELKYHTFTGEWSAPLTNITKDITVRPVYTFDFNSPDILTVAKWDEIARELNREEFWFEGKEDPELQELPYHPGDVVAVKGLYKDLINNYIEDGGTLSLRLWEQGEMYVELYTYAFHMAGPNYEPFYSTLQLQEGDTLVLFGTIGRQEYGDEGWSNSSVVCLKNGYVPYISAKEGSEYTYYIALSDAAALYDVDGDGLKQAVSVSKKQIGQYEQDYIYGTTDLQVDIAWTKPYTERFIPGTPFYEERVPYAQKSQYHLGEDVLFVEDVNKDGRQEVSFHTEGANPYVGDIQLFMSQNGGFQKIDTAVAPVVFDLNNDGRSDYLYAANHSPSQYGDIVYQLPDGTFRREKMNVMSWDDFIAQMTPEERDQYENPQDYSLGDVSRYEYVGALGGADLNRAPRREGPNRAPGIGYLINLPTKALDMNGDGLTDIIDENAGVIYTNMANGKWIETASNGAVIPVDLNNDGVTDFILPGTKLYTIIYNKETKQFDKALLYSNATVDDLVYCYDFDKDGDVDILATFSSARNKTNTSYSCFFINDGKGHFTMKNEQNYGEDKLWFSNCTDIDGDGNYDLLALLGTLKEHCISYESGGAYCRYYYDTVSVMWLPGGANGFAAPQKLYDLDLHGNQLELYSTGGGSDAYVRYSSSVRINAEDLNNDGKPEVWCSGFNKIWEDQLSKNTTEVFPVTEGVANARPTAPAKPALEYKKGILTVTWGNGEDEHTAVGDLTYALRIGTTPGGNEILLAHANADGTRRNFLNGNMGRAHAYTIDLNTYSPCMIYASVQTIDAQHAGSAWSEEASIAHTKISATFTVESDRIAFNEQAQIYFTKMPESYVHSWYYGDETAKVVAQTETSLTLQYAKPGEKTITHIVTAPNAEADTATLVLTVLPAGVEEPTEINTSSTGGKVNSIIQKPLADYTYDGRLDGAYINGDSEIEAIYEGVAGEDLFRVATGLWNSSILENNEAVYKTKWLDYNRDGHVDFLFQTNKTFAIMAHNPDKPELTERQNNDTIVLALGETNQLYNFGHDFRHTGMPDCFLRQNNDLSFIYVDPNGEYTAQSFAIDGNYADFQLLTSWPDQMLFADFDHDGYTDIAGVGERNNTSDKYTSLHVFYNRGNGRFVQKDIPFAEEMPSLSSIKLADFNGDGYIDLLWAENYWPDNIYHQYILWNNGNNSFAPRESLPYGPSENFEPTLSDIDNNGYPDIIATIPNEWEDDNKGIYVWYMGAEGIISHGFLVAKGDLISDLYLSADKHYLYSLGELYPIAAQEDARPAAPTGLKATQTQDGLLIEWNAAEDDHTPASLMRYNLSMKQQGAATYLFSPQNGGNANAQYVPDYNYINATRFLVPMSEVYNGKYEIALQAVDQQNKMSLFTETLVANIERSPIEVEHHSCSYYYLNVSYHGEPSTETPVWDFDSAVVLDGSGFGPYTVYWETGGEKVITLTLGQTVYTDTVTLENPYDLPIELPLVLYEGTPATPVLSEGVTGSWYAMINDEEEWHPITEHGIYRLSGNFIIYDKRLIANGLSIMAQEVNGYTSLCDEQVYLKFEFAVPSGCTGYYAYQVSVQKATNIPNLTLVTTDANGHNVISWTNADSFSTVNVYKEGNALNDFQLIGSADASEGSFVDANSDATQKTERYRLTGVTSYGSESPASAIHKTVHLTINRGVVDGTYNLIWNGYEGANVVSYNILRGASPTELYQIATVAASNLSYTDQTPDNNLPYYAIEYVLSGAAGAPDVHRAPQASLTGRSNVVNRKDLDQGLDDINAPESATKILIDNQIYILRSDKVYTLTGQEVK